VPESLRLGWRLSWPYAGLYLGQAGPFWRIFRLRLASRPRIWILTGVARSVGRRAWPCWPWVRERERHTRKSCSSRSYIRALDDFCWIEQDFRRGGQRCGRDSADMCVYVCMYVCMYVSRYYEGRRVHGISIRRDSA
jgi:hypothetical protein